MLTAAELLGRVQRGEVFADDTKVQYVHHVIGGHSWRPQMTVPAFYLHATQWQPKQWSGQTVGSLVAACELVLAHHRVQVLASRRHVHERTARSRC